MTITKKASPYVYRCTERASGKFYIGYRYKNIVPAKEDLGVHYFTSNKYVRQNFDNFDCEILSEFPDRKSAYAFETRIIRETASDLQINRDKLLKEKSDYKKPQINEYCLFPGCGKKINSSIKRFCCRTHSAQYAAYKRHGKI